MRSLALRALIVGVLAVRVGSMAGEAMAQEATNQALLPAALADSAWRLVEIDGNVPDPDLPPVTLAFGPARAEGSGGCNWYTAWLEISGDRKVAVSHLAATSRDCVHPRTMDLEARYLAALEGLTTYSLGGDALVLTAGDNTRLGFMRR